jgi:hypothetical protein
MRGPYDMGDRARKATTRPQLQRLLTAAKRQLNQCKLIGWPALEASWQQECEVIQVLLSRIEQRQLTEEAA